MATRPKILQWVPSDDPSKVSEPIDSKKDNGFIYKERPPFQYLNWLFNLIAKWIGFIDAEIDQFGVVAETIPSMSVVVRGGRKWDGTTYTVKADQTLGPISAPATNPRIDRIVLNRSTLVASVVTGTEAASPAAPTIPVSSIPLAQILINTTDTEIQQSAITPETSAYHEFFAQPEQYPAQKNFGPTTILTYGANISWNLNNAQAAKVTLTGATAQLDNPTNMKDGGTYSVRVTQDATGGRVLTFGSAYKWPLGIAPSLTSDPNAVDIITFISDGVYMYGSIMTDFK